MVIDENSLYPYLLYDNTPVCYSENITLYPVQMKDVLTFQQCSMAVTLRKNSIFPVKSIIKMSYLDFLFYCANHPGLGEEYDIPYLSYLYGFAVQLLKLVCRDAEISYGTESAFFKINGELVDGDKFDDLRRIIIIQNDLDFNIDEFIHHDTEEALKRAQEFESNKNKEKATIEDYIDSLVIGLKVTGDYVQNLSIRKFWRYIKRLSKHEDYQILHTAECGGMVTFKEPVRHWMTSIEVKDRYENFKTDERELRSRIE